MRSATPASWTARTESPPPTTVQPVALGERAGDRKRALGERAATRRRPSARSRTRCVRRRSAARSPRASSGRCRGRASRRAARRTASPASRRPPRTRPRRRRRPAGRPRTRTGSRSARPRPSCRRSGLRLRARRGSRARATLSSTFAPPEMITNGRSTSPSSAPRCCELLEQEQACVGGQQLRHARRSTHARGAPSRTRRST